ncbi:ribosomal protein L2 [Metschnikowia bicuspidata var. bicuspidata NRRL YB-4993]|uniref:Large ribosomal subunit protein uL2m n=1 Tax=Metschnikowia bicuspidata var. bicuspidata NRRL YB-4993 TaxID=869754 RepID=A0A1A0H755_9ASCO|nr:ribosomal protein L2 [Metschnikowia bicuspidata var. bicuspidata NRRL YB-4993]OBA19805.1 ribosomal protein L2 [Metschnikowia bicuspidata var. bicuspidata NRRL YB-4993]
MFALNKRSWGSAAQTLLRFRSSVASSPSLHAAPGENLSDMTDLEMKDETHKRQRKLAATQFKMKIYANGENQPGSLNFRKPIHDHLHKGSPIKELTVVKKQTAGRNNTGKITVRGRGGGHKRRVRLVDSHRLVAGKQTVLRIEYDPNRSGHIALIKHNETGSLSYILASSGLRAGDMVESFRKGIPSDFLQEMKLTNNGEVDEALLNSRVMQKGNCMPLKMFPVGSIIHNIGLRQDGRGQLVKAAGTFGRLLSKAPEKHRVIVRLSSGEHRYIHEDCHATLGMVSNREHLVISWGKAGRSRHRGFRPKVRGVAMNAHDHPHGGGRGKSKSNKVSQSMWGIKKFARTRKFKRVNKMKVKDRRA